MSELTHAIAAYGLDRRDVGLPLAPLVGGEWRELLGRVSAHRLSGLLVAAVEAGAMPVTSEQFDEVLALHSARMGTVVLLDRLLLDVCEVLAAASIDFRVLKGLAHAQLYYADPTLRPYSDVDLLVRGAQFDDAVKVLESLDITRPAPELRPGFDRRFGKGATLRTGAGDGVDLHRSFVAGPYAVLVDSDALFERPSTVVVGGTALPTLGTEMRLLHCCFHAAVSDDRTALIALRDVVQASLDPALDTPRALGIADGWSAGMVVANAVADAWATLQPSTVPPITRWANAFEPTRRESRIVRSYRGEDHRWARQALAAIPAVEGVRAKLVYTLAIAVPSRAARHGRRRSFSSVWRGGAVAFAKRIRRPPGAGERVMPHWLRSVLRMRPTDFAQAAAVCALLVGIESGLRLARVDRVAGILGVGFLADGSPPQAREPLALSMGERRWVRNANRVIRRWPFDATCLRRSLLVGWILRRHDSRLILGVRQRAGGIDAHAWVRVGAIDLDSDAGQFLTFGDDDDAELHRDEF